MQNSPYDVPPQESKEKNIGKYRTAGYFLELAKIIEKRRLSEI